MDRTIKAQERACWERELASRARDLETARARGDAAHLVAAAQLRVREADERLTAM